jgi:hypothetical protein
MMIFKMSYKGYIEVITFEISRRINRRLALFIMCLNSYCWQ